MVVVVVFLFTEILSMNTFIMITVLNITQRSIPVSSFASVLLDQSCCISVHVDIVNLDDLNPCWLGGSILWERKILWI